MPQNTMIWDPIPKEGKPTRSSKGNEVITKIKKFEVRKEGVVSQTRRPIEFNEFLNDIKLLRSNETVLGAKQFKTSYILSM